MRPAPPLLEGTALLVASEATLRRDVAETLRDLGLSVEVSREPYEGMASFLANPTDLVVVSLRSFRRRDLGFLRTIREHAAATRVLLLVPPSRRRISGRALDAGGDAILVEPHDSTELAAVVRALWRRGLVPRGGDAVPVPDRRSSPDVSRFAAEVAHAINNPLQVLALQMESDATARPGTTTLTSSEAVAALARVREVTTWLAAYGGLGPPRRTRIDVAELLEDVLRDAFHAGFVRYRIDGLGEASPADVDAVQVRTALRAATVLLAGVTADAPCEILARATRVGRTISIVLLAKNADRSLPNHPGIEGVVLTHDATRTPLPGLALPRAVAEAHGGKVTLEATPSGPLRFDLRLVS